jgi:VWFA-related protein
MQFRSRIAVAVALTIISVAAFAQLKETVSVNVVEVPVTVVDSSGNPVRGLKLENFKLLDQGKERPITSFDMIDFGSGGNAPNTALAPMNPAARRNFMLLFDLSNSQPASLARAQEAARQFVAKSVQPRDLVGVGTISVEHSFRLLTAFTSDRELIESAIGNPASFRSADPLQLSNETKLVTLDTTVPEGTGSGNGGLQGRQDRAADIAVESKERMTQIQRANEQYTRARVEKEVDFLGQLAKTLRAIPGRKQIIFLSEGFDPSVVQGRDARDSETQRAENDQVLSGQGYMVDNDQRYGSTTSQGVVERMSQFFRGSDVVLHAIDIQGVRVQNDVQGGSRINSNAGLGILASPTGGMVFQNSNSMQDNLGRMLHAQEVVYILAFQAPTTKPGTLHSLSVKLVNAPGGSKAFSRNGYFEGGNETQQERILTNAEIILNDIPQNELRVAELSAGFPTSSVNSQVPVILEIDGNDVMKDLKGNAANAEIYLYAFDSEGMVRDRMYQKMALDLKKVGDKLRANGIKYYATLSLPPGKYAVKALVRIPESDRRGFARADIVVPKANEMVVLPPIFVDDAPMKWVLIKGQSHDKSGAVDPFNLSGEPFIPAAQPRLKSGDTKRFAVFVHNANAADLTYETNPKVKFLGAAKNAGSTAFVMELGQVDPTLSSLDVTVHKKGVADAQKTSIALR